MKITVFTFFFFSQLAHNIVAEENSPVRKKEKERKANSVFLVVDGWISLNGYAVPCKG